MPADAPRERGIDMSLRARDRRILDEIERHLDADDPGLARLLAALPGSGTSRLVLRLWWAVLGSAVILMIAGLVLANPTTFIGGALVVAMLPIVMRILAAVAGVPRRSSPPHGSDSDGLGG
jgi:hypothetical protein